MKLTQPDPRSELCRIFAYVETALDGPVREKSREAILAAIEKTAPDNIDSVFQSLSNVTSLAWLGHEGTSSAIVDII
jgi:hypothetical protein